MFFIMSYKPFFSPLPESDSKYKRQDNNETSNKYSIYNTSKPCDIFSLVNRYSQTRPKEDIKPQGGQEGDTVSLRLLEE